MPVLDGYDATHALRRRPELRDLPIIAMTADAMVGDREKALAAGMNDHIAKPIKFDVMFATLARWVHAAGSAHAGSSIDGGVNRETRGAAADAAMNGDANGAPLAGLAGVDPDAGLAGLMGDVALDRRLLRMFRDGQSDFAARFRAARAAGDMVAATRTAHDLKSMAAVLGLHELQHQASMLEQACKDGTTGIDALEQAVTRLLAPVIQRLQTLEAEQVP